LLCEGNVLSLVDLIMALEAIVAIPSKIMLVKKDLNGKNKFNKGVLIGTIVTSVAATGAMVAGLIYLLVT